MTSTLRRLCIAAVPLLLVARSLSAQPVPACGNGIRETGEQCDDGNANNLDGCSSQCKLEQVQRINRLKMQFDSSASCTANLLGGAIGSSAQSGFQQTIDAGIQSGQTSVLFGMLGLDDLSGTADPAVQVGIVNGTPATGAGYDGTSDLDWWYTVNAGDVDGNRVPISQLSGSIASSLLTAGPGSADLTLQLWTNVTWHFSSLRISATNGSPSTPLSSIGAAPPGHVPSEHLDPALTSYGSSGSGITGELCGNIRAASFSATAVPASLLPGGSTPCSENYSVANSFLDVLVHGCHVILGITAIAPTQPDQQDPQAAPAGAGPPYVLSASNPTNKVTDTCRDHTGTAVPLSACLADAAYSSFFKFSTDRVIAVCTRPAAPAASNNGPICAGQTLQLTAAGAAGNYAWTGPNGFTSSEQNPQIVAASVSASGVYSVAVTAVDGCTSPPGTTTVVVDPLPSATISVPSSVCAGSPGNSASVPSAGAGATYLWGITNGTITSGQGSEAITFTPGSSGSVSLDVTVTDGNGCSAADSIAVPITPGPCASDFYALAPCRLIDTRDPDGPLGGPALAAGGDRTFVLAGQCGIPVNAAAISVNVTVTQPTGNGDLRLYPGGSPRPLVSTVNYGVGRTRANNAVVSLGPAGDLTVHCDQAAGTVHLVVDTNGYYQ